MRVRVRVRVRVNKFRVRFRVRFRFRVRIRVGLGIYLKKSPFSQKKSGTLRISVWRFTLFRWMKSSPIIL